MKRWLLRHPDSPPSPVEKIAVDAVRLVDGRLSFVYAAEGDLGRVRLPRAASPERADGLWRHTCFEAFVRPTEGAPYYEFNFSPASRWAAYRFECYRSGMASADVAPPQIKCVAQHRQLGLVASIALGALEELVPWQPWRIGVAAVIEADDGTVSHWALAHPPGAPDFHHDDCFDGELAPAETL